KTHEVVAATTEAHTYHANLSLRIGMLPLPSLIDEPLVPGLCACVVGITLCAIQHARNEVIFGARAGNVTAAEALVACAPQRFDLIIDLGNIGLVIGILELVIAGSVKCRYIQIFMRIVRMNQYGHAELGQRVARIHITLQLLGISLIVRNAITANAIGIDLVLVAHSMHPDQ